MTKFIFIKDEYYYIIIRDPGESYEQCIERGWFVVKNKPKTETELNNIINYSRIWANIKFNKCVYSKELHNIIDKMT